MFLGIKNSKNDLIISYGDIIFKEYVLHSLLTNQNEIVIVVDQDYRKYGKSIDYVQTKGEAKNFFNNNITLSNIFSSDHPNSNNKDINGEFIGLENKKTVT